MNNIVHHWCFKYCRKMFTFDVEHWCNQTRQRWGMSWYCSFTQNDELASETLTVNLNHRYPQHFFKFLTLPLTVVYYKVNYLPVGVRIWFWPNCRIQVFGDMVNFSSEIGQKWPKMVLKRLNFFGGAPLL